MRNMILLLFALSIMKTNFELHVDSITFVFLLNPKIVWYSLEGLGRIFRPA